MPVNNPQPSAASPRLVIETNTDVDHLDDGYHWRKYGQKTVKGSPYPRSYYKCTEKGCSVKKQVEQNGNSIVNSYEGTHTHLAPALDENGGDGLKKKRRPRRAPDASDVVVVNKKRPANEELNLERRDDLDNQQRLAEQHKRMRMQNMLEELTSHERNSSTTSSSDSHHSAPAHHSTLHHGNMSSTHQANAPVLPLINRQLMEPVPTSSIMNMHHPSPSMHLSSHSSNSGSHLMNSANSGAHLMNYFATSAMYPPSQTTSSSSASTSTYKLPHPTMDIMSGHQLHHPHLNDHHSNDLSQHHRSSPNDLPPHLRTNMTDHTESSTSSQAHTLPSPYGHMPFTLPPPNARNHPNLQ